MPRFGITGHVNLTSDTTDLVRVALIDVLSPFRGAGLTGISCLAPGADSIFAQVVLDLGGSLEALVPAEDYRSKIGSEHVDQYDDLVRSARVSVLPIARASHDAYEEANRILVASRLDQLFAVWDGVSRVSTGNTASAVAYAHRMSVPVHVVWPVGARRSQHL